MRRTAIPVVLALGVASLPLQLHAQAVDSATAQVRRTVFAPWLGVDLEHSRQTWSGTFVRDLVEGQGGPPPETMHGAQIVLRLWLADGTPVIDPARDANLLQPMSHRSGDTVWFVLGRGIVIRGLDEGIRGMRLGGVRQLVIPSSAGFGHEGRLNVPPNAVLVAEAKLVSAAYDPIRPATLECPSPGLAGTDSIAGGRRDAASIGCRGHRYQTIRIF
jgi:FKBP-type peptidyl-prolyl cis-trans isomerase FkpA